ncbi:MAG: LytR/AlgR family response regulator transcription factor [Gemmatimonadota bacterium]
MTALRVLIADDEPLSRDCVRLALAAQPGVEVVAECADGLEAAEAIPRLAPDLVFLDVRMPGLDGFEIIERIGAGRMPPVVFVTAFDAHAIRAFSTHALDYVLKPFEDARLAAAIERAREQIGLRREGELGRRLAALVRSAAPPPVTRLLVTRGEVSCFVALDDVECLAAERNYVRIHHRGGADLVRRPLDQLLSELDPTRFVRVHRSFAVNLARVREVRPWFSGDCVAVLDSGREVRVSRTYRSTLLKPLA